MRRFFVERTSNAHPANAIAIAVRHRVQRARSLANPLANLVPPSRARRRLDPRGPLARAR
jgi:hypothetical protein